MSDFVKADIGKLESFYNDSKDAIEEFAAIRNRFDEINSTLLNNWEGAAKASYKSVSDNILEKVGGIQDVLDTINDTIVKDLIDQYHAIDAELGESNRNAGEPEDGTV